jgi:hypothetical protein
MRFRIRPSRAATPSRESRTMTGMRCSVSKVLFVKALYSSSACWRWKPGASPSESQAETTYRRRICVLRVGVDCELHHAPGPSKQAVGTVGPCSNVGLTAGCRHFVKSGGSRRVSSRKRSHGGTAVPLVKAARSSISAHCSLAS